MAEDPDKFKQNINLWLGRISKDLRNLKFDLLQELADIKKPEEREVYEEIAEVIGLLAKAGEKLIRLNRKFLPPDNKKG